MWNLPNSLTLARIVMVPLLVVVLLTRFQGSEFWGLGIFLLAALTDLVDGIVARRTKAVTVAGTLLDPIADKLLISAAFISLVELGSAPAWMVALIVGREFAVTGLREVAHEQGIVIAASWWGKMKTLTQIVAISILIVGAELDRLVSSGRDSLTGTSGLVTMTGKVVLWMAVAMTVASLIDYFQHFWRRIVATR